MTQRNEQAEVDLHGNTRHTAAEPRRRSPASWATYADYYIRFERLQERVTKLEGGAAPARPKTDKEELGTWYERLVLARR